MPLGRRGMLTRAYALLDQALGRISRTLASEITVLFRKPGGPPQDAVPALTGAELIGPALLDELRSAWRRAEAAQGESAT